MSMPAKKSFEAEISTHSQQIVSKILNETSDLKSKRWLRMLFIPLQMTIQLS